MGCGWAALSASAILSDCHRSARDILTSYSVSPSIIECHRVSPSVILPSQHRQHSTLSSLYIIRTSDLTSDLQVSKKEIGINSVNAQ